MNKVKQTIITRPHIPQLIVALDVDNLKEAQQLIKILYPKVRIFKVGSQLFTSAGPKAIDAIKQKGADVFLDLKFHDIPNTVMNAVRQSVRLGVYMLDVHIQGGEEMLRAAVSAVKQEGSKLNIQPPLLLGITVLTSQISNKNTKQLVLERAQLGQKCGLDGVVSSVWEASLLRKKLGKNFLLVTPGIRFGDNLKGDQKRVAAPNEAVLAGSDYLVLGRPVIQSNQPLEVIKTIEAQVLLMQNPVKS